MPEYIPRIRGISRNRMRELYYFCRSYSDIKKERDNIYGSVSGSHAIRIGDEIVYADRVQGQSSDITANNAIRADKLSSQIAMIEQCATIADTELCRWILKAVTQGLSFIQASPPCCEKVFRRARHKFYIELDKRK